jgi:putative tricarboxylic transport membrane protein
MADNPARWRPDREVEIIASTPPGGGTDRCARALLQAIEANRLLDVPARVVNVAGDGGRKAWRHIAGRSGDARVIGINTPNNETDVLTGIVTRDEIRSVPVAILYTEYMAFIARSDSPIADGPGLLERLAAGPMDVTVSLSTSLGNPNHIALAKVFRHAGIPVTAPAVRVFDSARDVVADVGGGNADVGVITAASAVPELEAGQVRAIAVSSPARLTRAYARTPTWREQGVDCVIGSWRGVAAAGDITADHIAFWQEILSRAVATQEWKAELDRHFWTGMYLDGPALAGHLRREHDEMTELLGELGLLAA